jgi:hypothetical protein
VMRVQASACAECHESHGSSFDRFERLEVGMVLAASPQVVAAPEIRLHYRLHSTAGDLYSRFFEHVKQIC